MNFTKITRYLIKLRNSDPSETFSRLRFASLPTVSILLGDNNYVTVKASVRFCRNYRNLKQYQPTTDYNEALFSITDNRTVLINCRNCQKIIRGNISCRFKTVFIIKQLL